LLIGCNQHGRFLSNHTGDYCKSRFRSELMTNLDGELSQCIAVRYRADIPRGYEIAVISLRLLHQRRNMPRQTLRFKLSNFLFRPLQLITQLIDTFGEFLSWRL